jgi:hypothetical protein
MNMTALIIKYVNIGYAEEDAEILAALEIIEYYEKH